MCDHISKLNRAWSMRCKKEAVGWWPGASWSQSELRPADVQLDFSTKSESHNRTSSFFSTVHRDHITRHPTPTKVSVSYPWLWSEPWSRSCPGRIWPHRCNWQTGGCWWAPEHCGQWASRPPGSAPLHHLSTWRTAWERRLQRRSGWRCLRASPRDWWGGWRNGAAHGELWEYRGAEWGGTKERGRWDHWTDSVFDWVGFSCAPECELVGLMRLLQLYRLCFMLLKC